MNEEARFVSISDAARHLAVNRTRMYELVAQGRVPAVRLGEHGTIRIPVAWIEQVEREAMESAERREAVAR